MIGPAALSSDGLDGHWKTRFEEPVLGLLRLHSVCRLKIFSRVGDERPIARVIDGLHSGNDLHHAWDHADECA